MAIGLNGILDLSPFGIPTVLNNTAPSGAKVITEDYFWQSLRLGMRTQIPVDWGLSVKARAVLLPWTTTEMDDVHHLRTDLLQNPSFRSEAQGGFGYQLDAGLSYTVWKKLQVV